MPPSRGDAAGAPRGDLEVAAAPAPVGSAKRRTDASTAPSSCTSDEDDAARVARVAAPTRDADEAVRRNAGGAEPSSDAEPRRRAGTLARISASADGASTKPVTPETARRREVIARAMAVASAAAEAKAAEQRLAAKEARAAAARRAKARIRGEASPEKPEALSARDGVRGVGVSPSSPVETQRADADVATYATRVQGLELARRRRPVSTDVKDSDDCVASGDASGENRDADGGVIADAERTLWGGLWGDVKSASRGRGETINPYGAEENRGGPPGAGVGAGLEGIRSRRSGARGNEGARASKGAAATRKARADAKKRAHKAQVASARAADASGITGWVCDEESFFEYESVDGPFLPGAVAVSHAPSFGDAPRLAPAPRDWTRVKARVVCRRDADEEE